MQLNPGRVASFPFNPANAVFWTLGRFQFMPILPLYLTDLYQQRHAQILPENLRPGQQYELRS
jgi:hypothetical protein